MYAVTSLDTDDDTQKNLTMMDEILWVENFSTFPPDAIFKVETIYVNSTNCTVNESGVYCGGKYWEHPPKFDLSALVRVIVLSVIAVLSLVGNVATLWSIGKKKRQQSSTVYLLITHLAIADLMVTFFCIFAEAMWTATVQWYAGQIMCKLVKYLQVFALYLSTFVLVIIGFDRMCAVRYPMHRMHAKHQVRKGIVGVWLLSGILSIPQLVVFQVKKAPFLEPFYQCVTHGSYSAKWQEQLYTTGSLILMFVLPLTILITTYICTFCAISHSGKEKMLVNKSGPSPFDDVRHKIIQKAKLKSLMITVVIVLAFVICWTPYYVMMIIFIFLDPDEQFSKELQSAIFFFGSSTAMINPLIYGAFHLRSRSKRSTMNKNSSSAVSSKIEHSIVLSTLRKFRNQSKTNQSDPGNEPNGIACNGSSKPLLKDAAFTKSNSDVLLDKI